MTGHQRLIADLRILLDEAVRFEFHDFKNTKYASPKTVLDNKLRTIADDVRTGKYDSQPGEDGG